MKKIDENISDQDEGATIGRLFLKRTNICQNNNAIGWIESQALSFYTYQQYRSVIEVLSLGFIHHGLKRKDKVSIIGNTCKEWHLLDMASMIIGAAVVPIYPTHPLEELKYILNHSESRIICIEGEVEAEKILSLKDELKDIRLIILFSDIPTMAKEQLKEIGTVLTFEQLKQAGHISYRNNPDIFEDTLNTISGEEIATIMYTSGTSARPKGAVIKHKAIVQMLSNVDKAVQGAFGTNDRTLTFLPLSHVFGRCDSLLPLIFGWEMVFAQSIDSVIDDMKLVKPTIMLAVPRIFEKIYSKILHQISSDLQIKKSFFKWANQVTSHYFSVLDEDRSPRYIDFIQYKMAKEIVFNPIYQQFGGRIRYFVSGGAPISSDILQFMRNVNLTILEGYGLTETIAPCCLNPLGRQFPGSVGKPIGDVQIKFAADNEILIKTKALFSEYFKDPQITQSSFVDGWFKTGDIGTFTKDGFLMITDRKKDLIITSGGKNISPQKIENLMKKQSHIAQFIVIGDKRKYLTAIVGPERELILKNRERFKLKRNATLQEIAANPLVKELIRSEINLANKHLPRHEQIKDFIIANEEFKTHNYLTPKLSVKKEVLISDYSKKIDQLYQPHTE